MSYDPKVRTAGGNRARLRATASGDYGWPTPTAQRWAAAMAALACTDGRHRTVTNPEDGDEVCRWCGEVVEP